MTARTSPAAFAVNTPDGNYASDHAALSDSGSFTGTRGRMPVRAQPTPRSLGGIVMLKVKPSLVRVTAETTGAVPPRIEVANPMTRTRRDATRRQADIHFFPPTESNDRPVRIGLAPLQIFHVHLGGVDSSVQKPTRGWFTPTTRHKSTKWGTRKHPRQGYSRLAARCQDTPSAPQAGVSRWRKTEDVQFEAPEPGPPCPPKQKLRSTLSATLTIRSAIIAAMTPDQLAGAAERLREVLAEIDAGVIPATSAERAYVESSLNTIQRVTDASK